MGLFPPQRTLIFEHDLEGVPCQVDIWLAFQEFGTLTPSAGNLSIRRATQDDTTIAIKNDSCSALCLGGGVASHLLGLTG